MNCFGGWSVLWAFAALAGEPSQWEIKCPREGDRISVVSKEKSAVFVVTSKMGIGRGEIMLKQGTWPEEVRFQLQLKGLERFRVSNGEVTLQAAVSSQMNGTNLAYRIDRILTGHREQTLSDKDPFWLQIRAFDKSGRPPANFPAPDGTMFEIRLPKAFLDKAPRNLSVEWVDFFR